MLVVLSRLAPVYVDPTEPLLSYEGAEPPDFPSEAEQRRHGAAIAAFGSPAMLDKLDEYKKAAREFQFAVLATTR